MTGRIVYEPEKPHPCETPQYWTGMQTGTQWQCDGCWQIWRLDPHGWARNGQPGKRVEFGEYHVYPQFDLPEPGFEDPGIAENEGGSKATVLGIVGIIALVALAVWVAHLLGAPL